MSRDFDNTAGEYLEIADGGPADISGAAITIYARIRPDSNTSTRRIVAKWSSTTSQRQYMLQMNAGPLDGRSGGTGTNDSVTGATTVTTAAWHSAVYRKDSPATQHQVYLDGSQDGSAVATRAINNVSGALRLATEANDTNHFDGHIAEVAIWEAFLSAAEIRSLADGVCPLLVRHESLRGYWPLWGDSPDRDYSGGGQAATVNGTPVVGSINPPVCPHVLG